MTNGTNAWWRVDPVRLFHLVELRAWNAPTVFFAASFDQHCPEHKHVGWDVPFDSSGINANAGARGDSLEAVSYSCRWCCRGVLVRAYARGVLRFGRSMSGYGFSKRPASREDNQRHPLQCPTHNKPRTSPPCVSGTLSLGPSARLALHRNSSPEVRLEYRWSSPNHREMAPATLEPSVTQEVGSLGGVRW
eukprot:CAMPEP_0198131940 /NCGR_PEP_ID=MMETSP1442-20131203/57287_1 /TAXON_ID= /ORGANISM="Craspedostauros australis, Strain CCMP3328" /LENGTH=190 /DNA_ID=CAMNT_0043792847 /DNA_START=775 /DNA_END=1345 /DNA_ORIENTATION=-